MLGELFAATPRRWAIWRLGPVTSALFIAVDLLTLGWVGYDLATTTARARDWVVAAVLLLVAFAFEEGATRIAKLKWRLRSELKRDMTSVWSVAAAVALPPVPAATLVIMIYLHVWWRQRRPTGQLAHRAVYNSASVVASCLAAQRVAVAVNRTWSDLPWALGATVTVVLAIVVATAVNRGLISLALLGLGAPVRELVGSVEDNLSELSTLCLGGLVAVVAIHEPWLCILVLLPMSMLQRGSFVREIETEAVTDLKTGLLNAVGWEHIAVRELGRAKREHYAISVLIIDIDRFKLVNDRHGHLVGDQVLRGLGRELVAAMREYDSVARFGGEEFVVVLPETETLDAFDIAERIRARVNAITLESLADVDDESLLSVSIGVATAAPDCLPDSDLTAMLLAADRALYRAKGSGRNRVCLAADPDEQIDLQRA